MRFLTLIAAVLVLGLPSVHSEDWPRFLGPQSNGKSQEKGLLQKFPAEGPPVVWSKSIGTGYSAPSVQNDQLYIHHRLANEEIVECLNAKTGESKWRHAYPSHFVDPYGYNNGPRCTPLLTSDYCITFGAEGRIVCLDVKTGKLLWERETGKEWKIPEAFFGVGSTPLLDEGLLYVMVGGQPNSGMVALDVKTGKTVWESIGQKTWDGTPATGWPGEPIIPWRGHEKQASYASPVLAQIHGKKHLLCLMRQGLVSLDPRTGEKNFQLWFRSRVEDSVNAANPIVLDDTILISGAYFKVGSVALKVKPDGKSFEEAWRSTVLEIHWTTPILHEGHVYAFSGRNEPDARFRCVEFKTGTLKWERDESWRHDTQTPNKYGRGSAILADGKLIVLGEGGLLGLFEANPEKPVELGRWQVPGLHYPCWAAPVLSNKQLYLRSENRLICLNFAAPAK